MVVAYLSQSQLAALLSFVTQAPAMVARVADVSKSTAERPGCLHYRTNPICRPLPSKPALSPNSRTWAHVDFQSGRNYIPNFNANTGIDTLAPFSQKRDGSDPPVGHVSNGSRVVPQVVVCDRADWSKQICSAQKLERATVDFPAGAEPAGNSDHHYTWLDERKRGNWDCWLCSRPTTPGAEIHVGGLGFCSWGQRGAR